LLPLAEIIEPFFHGLLGVGREKLGGGFFRIGLCITRGRRLTECVSRRPRSHANSCEAKQKSPPAQSLDRRSHQEPTDSMIEKNNRGWRGFSRIFEIKAKRQID
jgi:hypothetical protein